MKKIGLKLIILMMALGLSGCSPSNLTLLANLLGDINVNPPNKNGYFGTNKNGYFKKSTHSHSNKVTTSNEHENSSFTRSERSFTRSKGYSQPGRSFSQSRNSFTDIEGFSTRQRSFRGETITSSSSTTEGFSVGF